MGSLSSSNSKARDAIIYQYNGVEPIRNLFNMYIEKDKKLKDGEPEKFVVEDVLVKVMEYYT
jgi:hypothetical protein